MFIAGRIFTSRDSESEHGSPEWTHSERRGGSSAFSFVNVEEEVFQSEAAVEQSSEKLVAGLVPHTLTSIIQLIL